MPIVAGSRLSCILIAASLFFLHSGLAVELKAGKGLSDWELNYINEAVEQIRLHALVPPKSNRATTTDILRSYSRFIDTYGDYLTHREFTSFMESTNSDYFGVEMDIDKRGDRIYLYPFAGGLAAQRGIRAGDELMAVNGEPVYGKSIYLVGSTIRGSEDIAVQLTIKRGQGIPRTFSLRRQGTRYESIRYQEFSAADYIRINRFVKNSAELLKAILHRIVYSDKTLIIDLRHNQGGDLQAARKCADFFLESGSILYRLKTRNRIRDITATESILSTSRPVLVQDSFTASAAEVFIAALVENNQAVSVGETTCGKGLAQRFFPLSDGSALRLTFAEILTPKNHAYNGKGLSPMKPLQRELIGQDITDDKFLQSVLFAAAIKDET